MAYLDFLSNKKHTEELKLISREEIDDILNMRLENV